MRSTIIETVDGIEILVSKLFMQFYFFSIKVNNNIPVSRIYNYN